MLMKFVVFAMLLCISFIGPSASASSSGKVGWRVAQAGNACLISCARDNDSCKRLCPPTYSGACISACDNQAQFCQQNCQRR
jgi:hypothetical protein